MQHYGRRGSVPQRFSGVHSPSPSPPDSYVSQTQLSQFSGDTFLDGGYLHEVYTPPQVIDPS